jgi:glucoamylase
MIKQQTVCVGLLFLVLSQARAHAWAGPLDSWIASETNLSTSYMLRNISPQGAARGAVIASPQQDNPNYYYHWVRDASITMDTVVNLYALSGDPSAKNQYYSMLADYVSFSRRNQLTSNPSGTPATTGLGEPKFNVDGSAFTGAWGRPQNDGPALRALTLIHFAEILLSEGQGLYVQNNLYAAEEPANTVIKADLEYVSHHWQDPSFDLWEEVKGTHFFTLSVMRKAMLKGAEIANRLGDGGAAAWYSTQAQAIAARLERHWDAGRGYIDETLDSDGGGKDKQSNLDGGVIIGAIIGAADGCGANDFPCSTNDRVLATAYHLQQSFQQIYAINQRRSTPSGEALGTAIGRYPEDTYDGIGGTQGNPWFILTSTFAELCYRAASGFTADGQIQITNLNLAFFQALSVKSLALSSGMTIVSSDSRFPLLIQALHDAGDAYLRRVQFHTDAQGALSEQMNRYTGYMQSARDLTWSYGSFLTASWAR